MNPLKRLIRSAFYKFAETPREKAIRSFSEEGFRLGGPVTMMNIPRDPVISNGILATGPSFSFVDSGYALTGCGATESKLQFTGGRIFEIDHYSQHLQSLQRRSGESVKSIQDAAKGKSVTAVDRPLVTDEDAKDAVTIRPDHLAELVAGWRPLPDDSKIVTSQCSSGQGYWHAPSPTFAW